MRVLSILTWIGWLCSLFLAYGIGLWRRDTASERCRKKFMTDQNAFFEERWKNLSAKDLK